jgi:ketosteroid isomerase-like protein
MKSLCMVATSMMLAPLLMSGQPNNEFLQQAASHPQEVKGHSVEQLLIQMERDWARAILAGDAAEVREILAPEIVLTTPEGTVLNREDDLAELQKAEFKADTFDPGEMKVRLYGDCAVVTGVTRVKGTYKGKEFQDQFRWTDTFVRRKGKWRIVASQAGPIAKTSQVR